MTVVDGVVVVVVVVVGSIDRFPMWPFLPRNPIRCFESVHVHSESVVPVTATNIESKPKNERDTVPRPPRVEPVVAIAE